MKLLRIIRAQGLIAPVLALLLASFILTLMVAYRIIVGCQVRHAYLVWNLFLAWMPLLFAVLAAERFPASGGLRDRKFMGLGLVWLLFFPNAPYIFTDVVHLFHGWRSSFWVELSMILLGAMTGFLAGFLSLRVMHGLVVRAHGRVAGGLFVAVVSGLAGFGVYLGRFVRLNSWDVLTDPLGLLKGAGMSVWLLATQWHHTKFLIVFSLFLLLGYVMLFALTHTKRVEVFHES
jgi:uncharacterized membrane protein